MCASGRASVNACMRRGGMQLSEQHRESSLATARLEVGAERRSWRELDVAERAGMSVAAAWKESRQAGRLAGRQVERQADKLGHRRGRQDSSSARLPRPIGP